MGLATQSVARQKLAQLRLDALKREAEMRQKRPPIDTSTVSMAPFKGKLPDPNVDLNRLWSPTGHLLREERRRQAYYDELIQKGYTPEQISGAIAYEEAIKPPTKTPQAIGSFATSLLYGQLIPGPVDEMAAGYRLLRATGQMAAAGAGGATGKAIQDIIDPDLEFNLNQLKKTFGEEAAYEGITLGLAPIGRRLFRGAKKTVIESGQELNQRLIQKGQQMGMKQSTHMLPAMYSTHQTIDTIQGLAEGNPFYANAMYQYKQGLLKPGRELMEEVPEAIARGSRNMTPGLMSDIIEDAIESKGLLFKQVTDDLYDALDVMIGGSQRVNLYPTTQTARRLLDMDARSRKAWLSGKTRTILRNLANQSDELPNMVSFETAQNMRSGLLDDIRMAGSKVNPDPKFVRAGNILVQSVDNAMEEAARIAGPEVYNQWRIANAAYKHSRQTFNNKILREMVHKITEPGLANKKEAIDYIFSTTENIKRTKAAVGHKVFQQAKGAWVEQAIRDAMQVDPATATATGPPLGRKFLNKFVRLIKDTGNTAFSQAEQKTILDNARILTIIQDATGGESGALRFVQGGAIAGIAISPIIGGEAGKKAAKTSGILALGPGVFGRLMTRPGWARMFMEGYKIPPGTQQEVAFLTRVIRNVLQERKKINEERQARRANELLSSISLKDITRMGP